MCEGIRGRSTGGWPTGFASFSELCAVIRFRALVLYEYLALGSPMGQGAR